MDELQDTCRNPSINDMDELQEHLPQSMHTMKLTGTIQSTLGKGRLKWGKP